jgi:hypothetical protein
MADSYINRAACKKLALRWVKDKRNGWDATRVSKQFLDDLNDRVRNIVTGSVARHRSVGKTIVDLQ